jgi:hypothetical protein
LLLAILFLGGCASYEPPQPCEPEARAHLARLAVPAQEIEELTIRADARAGHSSTKIRSHTAWTRVKSCDGHLIVVMGRACEFSRAYFQNSRGSDFPLLDQCPFISEN